MPVELQGGLKYVSQTLQGVMGRNPDGSLRTQMDWKVECAKFAKDFGKLATFSRDQIADVGLSCEDLVKKANAQLQSMPDIIDFVVAEPEQPAQDVPGEQATEEPEVSDAKVKAEDDSKTL